MTPEEYREAAKKVCLHHQADLDMDVQFMRARKGAGEALIAVRKNGSRFVWMPPFEEYPPAGERKRILFGSGFREDILANTLDAVKCVEPMSKLWFYWDGENVTRITRLLARKKIRKYVLEMSQQFEKHNGLSAEEAP